MSSRVMLLRRSLNLAPGFEAARELLARILGSTNQLHGALEQADLLVSKGPSNASHAMFKASILVRIQSVADTRTGTGITPPSSQTCRS